MFVLPVPLGPVREFIFGENSASKAPKFLKFTILSLFRYICCKCTVFYAFSDSGNALFFRVYRIYEGGLIRILRRVFEKKRFFLHAAETFYIYAGV